MQEQMNSMNDSGEFQEVESNYSARLSYVSSQPAMIPSSRSMLSRDKRLSLDTWNTSGLQETFLVINFLRLVHLEITMKEFTLAHHKENEDQFHRLWGRGLFSQEMTNKVETISMPTLARRPSTMSSTIRVEFPQNSMVGQQRLQNFGAAIRQIS